MLIRTRLLAVAVAVAAVLAPAGVAHASAPYALAVDASLPAVYPMVDGFKDTTVITGDVDAGGAIERIRGSVVVTVGTRVVKTYPLKATGPFTFSWNGKAPNGAIVSGTATVTLRVDGQAPVTDTLTVSPKKVVATTLTRTQIASDGIWCFDAGLNPDSPLQLDTEVLCPNSYGSPIPDYVYMTMRGTKTTAGLVYIGRFWDYNEVLKKSVFPVKVSVTGTFTQIGPGTSRFWVMPWSDYGTFTAGANPVRTFTHTSTLTASGSVTIDYAAGTYQPEWVVTVPKTASLRVTKFTIKTTYYLLK